MESPGYDIDGVAVPAVTKLSSRQLLIRQLLADSFNLRLHHEKTQVQGFVLMASKGGTKLKEVVAAGPGVSIGAKPTNGRGADIKTLARVLSNHLEHPVRDGTGRSGYYDFSMQWEPLSSSSTAMRHRIWSTLCRSSWD